MCRLLVLRGENIDVEEHLTAFADKISRSKEYQGDGWGYAYPRKGSWHMYKSTRPMWEDFEEFTNIGAVPLLLVHARSAFDPNTVDIRNNEPFVLNRWAFIFNGLVKGMRTRIDEPNPAETGAEKVFNMLVGKVNKNTGRTIPDNLEGTIRVIENRSRGIRALNFVISNINETYVYCRYSEDPEYFALRKYDDEDITIISSEEYGSYGFTRMRNKELKVIRL